MNRSRSTSRPEAGGTFDVELLEARPGLAIVRVAGARAAALFANEAGGHRWQRVPPTEKRGRVHSSTVTVAVLPEPDERDVPIDPSELRWETHKGSTGAGGQHANTSDSAVRLIHRPTGIEVNVEGRHQQRNRVRALQVLRARLVQAARQAERSQRNRERTRMVGSGMRADKRRTVAVQRGTVTDHQTGQRTTLRRYRAGHLADLH